MSALLGPEMLEHGADRRASGIVIVAARPPWGVAAIMLLLMVQYGSRRYEREGVAGIADLLPQRQRVC